ncbi:hypothetical protein Y032_0042g687 [Ancylostoma ceylanicum]|uniref:Secreted protein n=1 Tax=Ancylostoma ceylanicum TaxID=53326 RepID=A0A016UGP7_9BILA|nr:hypothetical protein Y032_0042g687 [Ancylostoma ceylanicum]
MFLFICSFFFEVLNTSTYVRFQKLTPECCRKKRIDVRKACRRVASGFPEKGDCKQKHAFVSCYNLSRTIVEIRSSSHFLRTLIATMVQLP